MMMFHMKTEGPYKLCGHLLVHYHTRIQGSQLNKTDPKQEET